jgi:uncharacterized membrane-anchored protein
MYDPTDQSMNKDFFKRFVAVLIGMGLAMIVQGTSLFLADDLLLLVLIGASILFVVLFMVLPIVKEDFKPPMWSVIAIACGIIALWIILTYM